MKSCLFCGQEGPYTKPEHIVPEALGNDDLLLWGEVCDPCNQYFGSKIESYVLGKTPLAFWRTYLGIRKKKNKLPHVELSQPKRQKGRLPAIHHSHDNLIGFTCHDDYSISVDIDDDYIVKGIMSGERNNFTFVFTPLMLSKMGRFFLKVGLELVCSMDSSRSRANIFSQAARFARFGEFEGLWPIFHYQSGDLKDLIDRSVDSQGIVDEVFCYRYCLHENEKYTLSVLTVGIDTWVVCLNNPYTTPVIRSTFPGEELSLIWYSPEQIKKKA